LRISSLSSSSSSPPSGTSRLPSGSRPLSISQRPLDPPHERPREPLPVRLAERQVEPRGEREYFARDLQRLVPVVRELPRRLDHEVGQRPALVPVVPRPVGLPEP